MSGSDADEREENGVVGEESGSESIPSGDEFYERVCAYFGIKDLDLRTCPTLTLAFIGDSIYDLVIRSIIVGRERTKPSRLHQHASHLVRAEAQAEMIDAMLPGMTDEEQTYYRRGRNAKPPTMAKNASAEDYHKATGFEALMGYLYLTGQTQRMLELIKVGLKGVGAAEVPAAE